MVKVRFGLHRCRRVVSNVQNWSLVSQQTNFDFQALQNPGLVDVNGVNWNSQPIRNVCRRSAIQPCFFKTGPCLIGKFTTNSSAGHSKNATGKNFDPGRIRVHILKRLRFNVVGSVAKRAGNLPTILARSLRKECFDSVGHNSPKPRTKSAFRRIIVERMNRF